MALVSPRRTLLQVIDNKEEENFKRKIKMGLNTIWFILITILFAGFFFLEGFDYGVGILLPFLGKTDQERRTIINTVGPHWDANEVWMIVAGGALFAAFPHVYATLFSGFYLALILLIAALIVRGVGFEFRSKREEKNWRNFWDWMIFAGSLLPSLLWGIVVGNLMRGVAIAQDMNYYGGLVPLLNPFALFTGLVFACLFIMHSANFLRIKLSDEIGKRVRNICLPAWIITLVLTVIFVVWTFVATDILTKPGINGLVFILLAALALLVTGWLVRTDKLGWAFIAGSLVIVLLTLTVFNGLYPRILISTQNPAWSLTINNASSSQYTLKIMTIIAAIFVPIVLVYQGWTYWVFRKRIGSRDEKLVY
jgi:cytochrome bd ubiquinol oxidase subunit II